MHPLLAAADTPSAPIWFCRRDTIAGILAGLTKEAQVWVAANGFESAAGRHLLLPSGDGGLAGALFGLESTDAPHRDGGHLRPRYGEHPP